MSRVFVIPDVHLKPWMFEKASELIAQGEYDHIVMLGDLVDDWDQERNLDLYAETFDAVVVRNEPDSDQVIVETEDGHVRAEDRNIEVYVDLSEE